MNSGLNKVINIKQNKIKCIIQNIKMNQKCKKNNISGVKCLNKNNLQRYIPFNKKHPNVCHKTGTWDKKTQDE